MDFHNTGSGFLAAIQGYLAASRQTGRTKRLIAYLTDDDRVVCTDSLIAGNLGDRCADVGKHPKIVVIPVKDWAKLRELSRVKGRTILDHTWVEEFHLESLRMSVAELDALEKRFSSVPKMGSKKASQAEAYESAAKNAALDPWIEHESASKPAIKPALAVGQIWLCRDGVAVTINSNDNHRVYPWNSGRDCHTDEGRAYKEYETPYDLVTLVSSTAKMTRLASGQAKVTVLEWKTKDDSTKSGVFVPGNADKALKVWVDQFMPHSYELLGVHELTYGTP